jgi:hypothetical protein
MKPCAVALVLLASQSGCASVYEPAANPRVQIRGDGALVKDGKTIKTLEEAVRGNPAAEAEARLASSSGLTGTVLMIGGPGILLGTEIAGYSLSAGQKTLTPASVAVLLGGVVVGVGTLIAGAIAASNGDRHGRNAINRYNDGLPPSPCPPLPPAPQ